MTSRRNFLGLLAAAPVVGPEMVKAAVQEAPHRYAFARALRGATGVSGAIGSAGVQRLTIEVDTFAAQEYIRTTTEQIQRLMMLDDNGIPNRLHGSYINADGDAT